jgi:RimJ/RimL family protein N-acetyltransferase
MPSIPELLQPLTDGEVSLRFPSEWDIPEILIAHEDDPSLHTALGQTRPPTGAELGRAVETDAQERAAGRHVELTVVAAGSEDCIGRISVGPIDWTGGGAQLTIWIAPGLRRRGFATRALALARPWLTGVCGLSRLTGPDGAEVVPAPD